jgi:hypothetical protein
MCRGLEHPPYRRVLGDETVLHDDDTVGRLRHQPHVVPDQDEPAAQLFLRGDECRHDLLLRDDIECRGGFVGNDQLRLHGQRDRHAGALLHAARQLVRESAGECGIEADISQRARDECARVAFG